MKRRTAPASPSLPINGRTCDRRVASYHARPMRSSLTYIDVLVTALAGWMNDHQRRTLAYLLEENRVLRQQIGKRRLRLTDDQRRRLAKRGRALGRALLDRFATIVSPETILEWHRRLIAAKWSGPSGPSGRRTTCAQIVAIVLRIARDNPSWGYRRIQGALRNLGHTICANTVKKILKNHGIDPAPQRETSWRTFLRSHASVIAAADFFTTEVWTTRGLVPHYTLFVIDHATRAIEIVGTTTNPAADFMQQLARNLTDSVDGFINAKRYLILDRDTIYCDAFKAILRAARVEPTMIPPSSPNCNAFAERFVRSIKSECLDRIVFFGTDSLHRALAAYAAHYNAERNHQGVGNNLIAPEVRVGHRFGRIRKRERLGGLLNFYHRAA